MNVWHFTDGMMLKSAAAAADKEWAWYAEQALHRVCFSKAEFTSDDVWGALPPHVRTDDPRALGPVMRRGAGRWCEATDRVVSSRRKQNHGRPVRVWRSLTRG